jgi:hypothetical protein
MISSWWQMFRQFEHCGLLAPLVESSLVLIAVASLRPCFMRFQDSGDLGF